MIGTHPGRAADRTRRLAEVASPPIRAPVPAAAMPRWAVAEEDRPSGAKILPPRLFSFLATVLLCGMLAAASGLLGVEGYVGASWVMMIGAATVAAAFLLSAWRAESRTRAGLAEAQRRYMEIYDRAGISIWQEDWSRVGDALLELRRAGVADVPGWLAAHPEESRALHAAVLITDVNNFSVQLMGAADKGQLLGSLAEVLPGSFFTFPKWLAAFARGDEVYVNESRIRRVDGSTLDCLVTAALPTTLAGFRSIMVSIIDIGAYKRDQDRLAEAEQEVARAQRIATVGALTASIAHEVNSPLAAVASNAAATLRWLRHDPPEMKEAQEAVEAVVVAAERARAVIDRTRSFLSKSERRKEVIDLRKLILDSTPLVEREAKTHSVAIELDLPEDLPPVSGDPVQIQQVLVNLMVNGIQAMTASAQPRRLGVAAAPRGDAVLIAVNDSGVGIPDERMPQIFTPFYSTKESGMGMGLAICRSCVEAHGGDLAVRSVPGTGSIFEVTLPLAQEA